MTMKFYMIGTGNTAWYFVDRLINAGHTCNGIYGRTMAKANELAEKANTTTIAEITDIKDDADCCIIAISDNAIIEIVKQLNFEKTVLIHTAGSVDRSILTEAAPHNSVLWPVYSINKEDLPRHRDVPIVVEVSDMQAVKVTSEMVNSITDKFFTVDSTQRAWLHLSAVLSNNFANHLFAISEQICKEHNLPFPILQPIINQTIERLQTQNAKDAQTGPAIRKDLSTIDKHINMLEDLPYWQDLYESITSSIDKMYNLDSADKSTNH